MRGRFCNDINTNGIIIKNKWDILINLANNLIWNFTRICFLYFSFCVSFFESIFIVVILHFFYFFFISFFFVFRRPTTQACFEGKFKSERSTVSATQEGTIDVLRFLNFNSLITSFNRKLLMVLNSRARWAPDLG